MYDVAIVGGGPAGLSAALVLGRCRRKVLVLDSGKQRNSASHALHGFLTRDGIAPQELLRIGRGELARYEVEMRDAEVVDACATDEGFLISLAGGERLTARCLLLATGVVDHLPKISGFAELYGQGVFHCPYCDGWEVRDQPLAVYGRGQSAVGLSISLKTWSADVVLCSDGRPRLRARDAELLAKSNIAVRSERIERLEGADGFLSRIVFHDGSSIDRRALFFSTGQRQKSPLAIRLGCEFNEKGTVRTAANQSTRVRGLFVAGDADHDVQFVVVAAAEGAKAAVSINKMLQEKTYSTTPSG